nr:MAG TPA_asm: hypothetical protein [Caudoviricetes sp.]
MYQYFTISIFLVQYFYVKRCRLIGERRQEVVIK